MDAEQVAVVVEDDVDIRGLVVRVLADAGFTVHETASGIDGIELARRHSPMVMSVDLGLPDIDGLEVVREVRSFSAHYIVILTARSDEGNTVAGLEAGADDYLAKPFRPREFRARIERSLRNRRKAAGADGSFPDGTTGDQAIRTHNGLVLDAGTREVAVDGKQVDLTVSEFDLLRMLLDGGRRVLGRSEMVSRLRAGDNGGGTYVAGPDDRLIEVHVANVRRKLADDARRPRWVETVRGVGYRLALTEDAGGGTSEV